MAKLFEVDKISELTNITRQGTVQRTYRVEATTQSGISFTVDIPAADFTKDKAHHILTEKATLLEEVKGL